MSLSDDYVSLLNGPTLPRAVVHLAVDLELRGMRLLADGDKLTVSPGANLTDDDRALIRQWKSHLLALVTYQPPAPAWTVQ